MWLEDKSWLIIIVIHLKNCVKNNIVSLMLMNISGIWINTTIEIDLMKDFFNKKLLNHLSSIFMSSYSYERGENIWGSDGNQQE